jgi:adenosylcobinamide kinase/adenosylcobinamide-phosphate guanylyltransferase
MIELILGGTRSGKSRLAERRAHDWCRAPDRQVACVATAQAGDAEMAARIARHRADRPAGWPTVEVPLALAVALRQQAAPERLLVVDCLTLWLANLFFAGRAAAQAEAGEPVDCPLLAGEVEALLAALPTLAGELVLVSNEIGCGLMPANALARAFADQQGWLNQRVAGLAERVTLVAAGLPLVLKTPSPAHGS